jgi:hypothetical protein
MVRIAFLDKLAALLFGPHKPARALGGGSRLAPQPDATPDPIKHLGPGGPRITTKWPTLNQEAGGPDYSDQLGVGIDRTRGPFRAPPGAYADTEQERRRQQAIMDAVHVGESAEDHAAIATSVGVVGAAANVVVPGAGKAITTAVGAVEGAIGAALGALGGNEKVDKYFVFQVDRSKSTYEPPNSGLGPTRIGGNYGRGSLAGDGDGAAQLGSTSPGQSFDVVSDGTSSAPIFNFSRTRPLLADEES